MNATMISRSGATLTPTFVERGHSNWQYFSDEEGNLWGGRRGTQPRFISYHGTWRGQGGEDQADGTLQNRFAKPVPVVPESPTPEAPAPTPKAKARRRFGFSFPVQLAGVQGELTIEADTLKEAKDTLEEVKATAAKYKHLGIVVGVVPKPEDEYFVVLADGTQFCRKHGEVMRLRQKQGDEWWSHDVGNECYCRGRPGKDSPGWEK